MLGDHLDLTAGEGRNDRGMILQNFKGALGSGHLDKLDVSIEKPFFRSYDFEFHGTNVVLAFFSLF